MVRRIKSNQANKIKTPPTTITTTTTIATITTITTRTINLSHDQESPLQQHLKKTNSSQHLQLPSPPPLLFSLPSPPFERGKQKPPYTFVGDVVVEVLSLCFRSIFRGDSTSFFLFRLHLFRHFGFSFLFLFFSQENVFEAWESSF